MSIGIFRSKFSFLAWAGTDCVFALLLVAAVLGDSRTAFVCGNVAIAMFLAATVLFTAIPWAADFVARRWASMPMAPLMMADIAIDGLAVIFLCLFSPWYTWGMYLVAAALSANFMARVIAVTGDQQEHS